MPSSSQLSLAIVKTAEVSHSHSVIELGPGTGVITAQIEKRLSKQAKFFAIELSSCLADSVRKDFPNLTVYNGCATEIEKYMSIHGMTECDTVISGLPWVSFPQPMQTCMLDAIVSVLPKGGTFVTFAYLGVHLLPAGRRIREMLEKRFSLVHKTEVVWKNVPPAFIYHCTK